MFGHCGCIRSAMHRSLLVLLCVPRMILLLNQAGSAQLSFTCKQVPFFDLIIRWLESLDFGPNSDDLGHRVSQIRFYPVGFCKIGLHKQAHPFSDRQIKNRRSESDGIIS